MARRFAPTRRVQEALIEAGATLVRATHHAVYRLPNGRQIVMSRTPSDRRAEQNILAEIRRQQQW